MGREPLQLPDFSDFFRTDDAGPLRFRVRPLANHVHDVHFLSGYVHDARFTPGSIQRRGEEIHIPLDRDRWENRSNKAGHVSELRTTRSLLTISPVSSVRWEIADPFDLEPWLEIESVYLGATHWEVIDASELVISAPCAGWRLIISITQDFGDIRLTDEPA